jgi:hypothetical protein
VGKAREQTQGHKSIETSINLDQGVDTKNAAVVLGCSVGYLKARRQNGDGPDYYRLGVKAFYTLRGLYAYREKNMVRGAR